MKKMFVLSALLLGMLQVHAQITVSIVNNQPNDVLVELGWNDNTVLPFLTSFKTHVPDFQCVAAGATAVITPASPNWDILKGFKIHCPFGTCSLAQTYTDNGPWSGDPSVAPIWHMGFLLPTGSINHYDCNSGSLIGTVDWYFNSTSCPFPYGYFTIIIN
ncbi:MAG: hypothetical protein AAF985_01565 [Bacteroidota bacterium]